MRRAIAAALFAATALTPATAFAADRVPPPPIVVNLDGSACDSYYTTILYVYNTLTVCLYMPPNES
jgi:hypothetical protein